MCATHHHNHHCILNNTFDSKSTVNLRSVLVVVNKYRNNNNIPNSRNKSSSTGNTCISSSMLLLRSSSSLLNLIFVLFLFLIISLPYNHNNILPFSCSSSSIGSSSFVDAFQISFNLLRQQSSSLPQIINPKGWTTTEQQQHYQHISTSKRRTKRISELSLSSSSTTTTSIIPNSMNITLPSISKSTTTKRIFWIRHGEVINPGQIYNKSVYYGNMNVPLSIYGQQEAIAAGQFLSQYKLNQVYSSNLSRAIYGAEQILLLQKKENHNIDTTDSLEVIQVPDFMELNRGDWCNKTIDEIGKELMEQFNLCNEKVTPNNGESYITLNERVMNGRNHIILQQLQYGQSCAVVSHLQVTRCIVADALHIPINEIYKIPISTASITCIDYIYNNNDNTDNDNNDTTNDISQPIQQIVHFQSYKPEIGNRDSIDNAN